MEIQIRSVYKRRPQLLRIQHRDGISFQLSLSLIKQSVQLQGLKKKKVLRSSGMTD